MSIHQRGMDSLDVNKGRTIGIMKGIVLPALIMFLLLLASDTSVLLTSDADAACECAVCHGDKHDEGWKGCTSCHGNPPLVNTIGGPDGLVGFPSPTGSITAGAHAKHATASGMNYVCGVCHNQGMPETPIAGNYRIQIGFGGGSYDGRTLSPPYSYEGTNGTTITTNASQTCSNIYCHSDSTSVATGVVTGQSPPWDGTFPMACSNWTGQSCAASGCHAYGILINPAQAYNYEYRSCYFCHGLNTPSGFTKSSYPSSPHKCYGCHNYPANYEHDQPKSNSHGTHQSFACDYCHFATTSDGMTITGPSYHANGFYDVTPNPNRSFQYYTGPDPVSFQYAYDPGGGKCSNISCHINMLYSPSYTWGNENLTISVPVSAGPACAQVNFQVSVFPPSGRPPYTYLWNFGDGTTSTEQNPIHYYPAPGSYTATIEVRDADRHLGQKTLNVFAPSVNIAPVANFAVSVYGWTVTLTDLSYDTDYNQCGHSGPGHIEIMWGIYDGRTNDAINLTDQPSNKIYTHIYSIPNSSTYISDIITDNSMVRTTKAIPVSIPTTYAIGGRVANAAGVGLKDAIIYLRTMSGASPPVGSNYKYTDANGYFTFTGSAVEGECYIVKQPIKPGWGYTFTPGDQTVCAATADVNFVSSP